MSPHILLIKCVYSSAGPHAEMDDSAGADRKILSEEAAGIKMGKRLEHPPVRPPLDCIDYAHYLSYFWANDERTRDALGIKDGTVDEWVRCQDGGVPYTRDILSSIKYHCNVTANERRPRFGGAASGDAGVGEVPWLPHRRRMEGVASPWPVCRIHHNLLQQHDIRDRKGGGHTAPEYEPDRCFAMFSRWILNQPL
ncbi:unnamed protein product [Triticum turgidum subsp. durum]|uniref:Uncharacterized protein n=1 Tax=Triticum turgidum subsp. durum TaxID=4567 RepID=A0A9R1P2A1_TRITD|nr:unnamed protein product [Triticum turgidum subsp. durum]